MKQLPAFIKTVLLLTLFFSSECLHAQHNPILENFTATQNGGKVYLSWTITSGSTCNGIDILRSTDSISFNSISNIAGTCGSLTVAVTYQFTDNNPIKNKTNYYRLDLGGNGSSEILAVEIIDVSNGYQLRPHPVKDYGKLFFQKASNTAHLLIVYNPSAGIELQQTTTNNYFEIFPKQLNPGMYFFTIVAAGGISLVKGKIIISG